LAKKARADDPPKADAPAAAPAPADAPKADAPKADAAAAKPPPPPSAIHFPVLKPTDFDEKKFWATLKSKHKYKFVFASVTPHLIIPGLSSLYIHVQNLLNADEFSFKWGKGKVGSLAVLYGPSIIYAFNDAMWAKYPFGVVGNMKDAAGKPETSNVYWKAQTNLNGDGDPGAGGNVYQDWSGEACVKRGTTFMVCHNAMAAFAGLMSMETGGDPAATLADWKANMLPGHMVVPAGVGALHAAMENGWKMIPII
jgi:hypothetical protein